MEDGQVEDGQVKDGQVEDGTPAGVRPQRKAAMKGFWIVLAALLALPASGQERPVCRVPESGGCTLAGAEIAFIQGLRLLRASGSGPDGSGPDGSENRLEQAVRCFEQAVRCHPEHGSALFWLGVTRLEQGKPDAVRNIRGSLEAREPPRTDRWRILAHLGEALLAAGEERSAVRRLRAALERVVKALNAPDGSPRALSEKDAGAVYRLGSALQAVGKPQHGARAVRLAQRLDPQAEARGISRSWPEYRGPFWPPARPWQWDGQAGWAAGADSNPNVLDDELVLRTPEGERVEGSASDSVQELDFRLAFSRVAPEDFEEPGSRSLGITLQGSQSLHQNLDYLDVGQLRAAVHLAWGQDPLHRLHGPAGYTRVPYGWSRVAVLLQAGYVYTQLDRETYFQGAGAAVAVRLREARVTETQLELAYQDFDFAEARTEDRDRSGALYQLDISQFFYWKRQDRYLRAGLKLAERHAGRAYARAFREAYFEAALPVHPKWTLLLTGGVLREEFGHAESNLFIPAADSEPRQDTTRQAAVTLVWSLNPALKFFARAGYGERDSRLELPPGIPGLGYERHRAAVGIRWFFGAGFSRGGSFGGGG